MKPTGDLEQRLARNFEGSVYELVRAPDLAEVLELTDSGKATVKLALPVGSLAIKWTLSKGAVGVLKEQVNADGAFILQRADGSFEAHVVECKKTVNASKWRNVRKQMRWTLSILRGIAGVLGIELHRGVLYTAFRTNDLSPESAPNPIAQRRPLGPAPAPDDLQAAFSFDRRAQREWDDDSITFTDFEGPFAHRKVELDDQGRGSLPFACD